MKIDLTAPEEGKYDSIYCVSNFCMGDQTVYIVGADPVLHHVVQKAAAGVGRLDSAGIRSIYSDVPGHYALIIRNGRKIIAVTDPYGIIKLYWHHTDGVSVLCDAPAELAGATVSLDNEAVKFFVVCGYTPARHTFFRNIAKLEPCRSYEFESGRLVSAKTYARFGEEKLSGTEFLDQFLTCMNASLEPYLKHYPRGCLFLSGGIDSSFLYKLLSRTNRDEWLDLLVGRTDGLGQTHKIDNDYDIEYSDRLTREDGRNVTIAPYGVTEGQVLGDFIALRDALFTEYAPAFAYMGMARAVPSDNVIINGQNADSVLSFGSMGAPRFQSGSITGLHGFFSRYFHFFGHRPNVSVSYVIARVLRWAYYKSKAQVGRDTFSDRSYFLGIGMQPENNYFMPSDPVFQVVHRPEDMADWFEEQYLKPLWSEFSNTDQHAQSVILYNRTYMQGSANRSTVASALIQKRNIFLPYTSLSVLELMTRLRPDWRYAYYGKYPNIAVGSRLGLPNYIVDRCDPNNSESSLLLLKALFKNMEFSLFVRKAVAEIDWGRYVAILNRDVIARLRRYGHETEASASDFSLLMKLAWLESTMQTFHVV